MAVLIAYAGDILTLSQTIDSNIKGGYASDFLSLSHGVRSNFVFGVARNMLSFNSRANTVTTLNLTASNTLVMSQSTFPRVHVVEAHSYFILAHSTEQPIHGLAESAFTLTSEAECNVSKSAVNTLTFAQEVTYELVNAVEATNTLVLVQGATCYVV